MPTHDFKNVGDVLNFELLKGVIKSVDPITDTCVVTVDGSDTTALLFYHCCPDSILKDNGAIDGAAAGFKVDDPVVVMKNSDGSVIKVIGHNDGIHKCVPYIVFEINTPVVFKGNDIYFVWDVLNNKALEWKDGTNTSWTAYTDGYGNVHDKTELSEWLVHKPLQNEQSPDEDTRFNYMFGYQESCSINDVIDPDSTLYSTGSIHSACPLLTPGMVDTWEYDGVTMGFTSHFNAWHGGKQFECYLPQGGGLMNKWTGFRTEVTWIYSPPDVSEILTFWSPIGSDTYSALRQPFDGWYYFQYYYFPDMNGIYSKEVIVTFYYTQLFNRFTKERSFIVHAQSLYLPQIPDDDYAGTTGCDWKTKGRNTKLETQIISAINLVYENFKPWPDGLLFLTLGITAWAVGGTRRNSQRVD